MKIRTLLLLALLTACSAQQRAETARAAEVFACEVDVLTPYVPDALDAADLAAQAVTGKTDLAVTLARLGVPVADVPGVISAFNACFGLAPIPAELEQARIVAPPPAYGNKVL